MAAEAFPTPSRESAVSRFVRATAAVALALAATLIVALAVLGLAPASRLAFKPLFIATPQPAWGVLLFALLLLVLFPAGLLFWPYVRRALRPASAGSGGIERRGKFRWLSWPWIGVGAVLVLPVLAWLAHDEPAGAVRNDLQLGPSEFAGAAESYAALNEFLTESPAEPAPALPDSPLAVRDFPFGPQEHAAWVGFVRAQHNQFAADWAVLAPQWRWLKKLASFAHIGDLTPATASARTVSLTGWRILALHVCATATLQSVDGHADEALDTLVPLLEVCRKLRESSRSLSRTVMAQMTERMALETVALVLDRGGATAAARQRVAAVLADDNAAAGARRLVLVDALRVAPVIHSMRLGDATVATAGTGSFLRVPLNVLGVFLLNPNATTSLYSHHLGDLCGLAEARRLEAFDERTQAFRDNLRLGSGMKNLGGRLLIYLAAPPVNRALAVHWENADLRARLHQVLAGGN